MILTIDVGNTNITCGIFEGEKLVSHYRMTTQMPRTSDEYGFFLREMISYRGISHEKVEGVVIASVVPNVMHSLQNAIRKYFGCRMLIVGTGTKTGIRVTTAHPAEVGADRIVDAVAAFARYGGPVMVIDFGTATTYDLITEEGEFSVGITSPGIRMCATALWRDTAKLPEIEIEMPKSILARDTVSSMQAGLLYGCIGQTEYIIRRVREEAGLASMKVVATGGLGRIISDETKAIDTYDPDLTLDGLRLIWEKNEKTTGKKGRAAGV